MPLSTIQRIIGIFGWFLICLISLLICGLCVAIGFAGDDSWYQGLNKPYWAPPATVMAWVWIALFTMKSVAVWHVWIQREEPMARLAVKFFLGALVLNVVWVMAWILFRNPYCGVIQGIVLWMAILATLGLFWQRSRIAGLLLFPGFLWVTFAAYLNFAIWQMNP